MLRQPSSYPGVLISRGARSLYQLTPSLFFASGRIRFTHFQTSRIVAHLINQKHQASQFPERAIQAGFINAMGMLDEMLDFLFELWLEDNGRQHLAEITTEIRQNIGPDTFDSYVRRFLLEFPPDDLFHGNSSPESYLHTRVAPDLVRELIRFHLLDFNPALRPAGVLFKSDPIRKDPLFSRLLAALERAFEKHPRLGDDNLTLLQALREPAEKHPHSVFDQLDFILRKWGKVLGKRYFRLLRSLDFLREEEKSHHFFKGETHVYDFAHDFTREEPERFSPDRDWMPRLVLIAKSTYVWLDQLSKRYDRPIHRLDQIPDNELDLLANWGFTGLWLIGLWERSKASRKLKHIFGRQDAIASAYSLYDYTIAADLGGWEALENLKQRAWNRGIRLASDMVPNHTGLDSRWMEEHPDWFIQSPSPPFPAYQFQSENLRDDPGYEVRIEDHYYDRSDAAVVFQRRHGDDVRYVYHGNDGTSMPWNDTAQLDYLNPDVRQAVLDKIIRIAKMFPIIRFDAAMTLTRKHFQRLWYPEPGSGGDIPSRTEYGMTRSEFEEKVPEEFWRQVVDRVAAEAPDTLLLAEAFWLMEGFFVRTLGMHRVYNSAFMNMLKKEENAKYRQTIRNVLEFNPQILKRFVNFMNNPDEETAVAQFGTDDKYFGVCTMMITMPGLPMFGHGQIEGLKERYGMEYARPMWDEEPEKDLIRRHEREIFPLMRKRYLFAEVEHFILYDFVDHHGSVNDNVFAWSNRYGDERGLVVYNNKFADAAGWVRFSHVRYPEGGTDPIPLHDGLSLHSGDFVIFRDHTDGLQYIRPLSGIQDMGLYVELGAFKYHVFLDFVMVEDGPNHRYEQLNRFLSGRGVPDIQEALRETFLQPLIRKFGELVSTGNFHRLWDLYRKRPRTVHLPDIQTAMTELLAEASEHLPEHGDLEAIVIKVLRELEVILRHDFFADVSRCCPHPDTGRTLSMIRSHFGNERDFHLLVGWVFIHRIGEIEEGAWMAERSCAYLDEWFLSKRLTQVFRELGLNDDEATASVDMIRILTRHQRWWIPASSISSIVRALLEDSGVRDYLGINRWRDILWFNKEQFEGLISWLSALALLDAVVTGASDTQIAESFVERNQLIGKMLSAARESGYQVDRLISLLRDMDRKTLADETDPVPVHKPLDS